MREEHKTASARFSGLSIPVLAILVLCIVLFSTVVSADWAKCVQARLDGANAVRLLVTADEKGTVTFTIGKNVITFAVSANVELDTGKLRIDDAESVVVELRDAAAVTARCTIPIEQLAPRDKTFCCDKTPPVIELTVTPNGDGKTVSWKIEDASSGVKECRVTLVANGKEHVLSSDCVGQRVLLASEFGAGTHEIHIRAIDEAGNEATASQKVVLAEPTCSISGQVIDATSKQPIAGATVTLSGTGRSQVTNAQGRFSFSDVTPSYHQYLEFFKDGAYEYRSLSVTCKAGEDRPIVVPLVPVPVAGVELSWTEDGADSADERTVHVDDAVSLYVSVPEGATYYVGFDAAANSEEPRAVFSGTELDLSIWMKTLPSSLCGAHGCEVSPWDIVMDCEDYVVYFQVIGIMPDGSVVTSEVLTLHIDLI